MKSEFFLTFLFAGLISIPASGQDTNKPASAKTTSTLPSLPPQTAPVLSLFDGQTLKGWKETNFGGSGGTSVVDGEIRIDMGAELSGITFTNVARLLKANYEISLEAMKRSGTDFFCGLTFPVNTNHCTLVVGGWGGGLVGLSSLDGMDASENETTKYRSFDKNKWYKIRVRVTPETITTWIDDEQVNHVDIKGRKVSMRFGDIEQSAPLGIATYQTSASFRNIQIKRL